MMLNLDVQETVSLIEFLQMGLDRAEENGTLTKQEYDRLLRIRVKLRVQSESESRAISSALDRCHMALDPHSNAYHQVVEEDAPEKGGSAR